MEMYLSHMVIFRVIEKLHLNTIVGNGVAQYIATVSVVVVGTICFAFAMQRVLKLIEKRIILAKKGELIRKW